MKKLEMMLILVTVIFLGGCFNTNEPPSTPMITTSSTTVVVGQEVNLQAIATDPDGDPITYLWQATGGSFNSASGNMVIWTSPNSVGIYTITVDAKDSHGASSSSSTNSININVIASSTGTGGTPTGGAGGVNLPKEIEVIIGHKDTKMWGPFPGGNREYGLMQYLYYSNEIGRNGKIVKIAVMPSATAEKDCSNMRIYMSMVNRDELSNIVAENYEGPKPAPSAIIPSIQYGGRDNIDKWTEFTLNTPFEYDGNKNLLIAFESSPDKNDPMSVSSYAFNAQAGNKKRWLDLRTSDGTTANPNPGALHLKITFLVP